MQSDERNRLQSQENNCLKQNQKDPFLPCVGDNSSNKTPSPVSSPPVVSPASIPLVHLNPSSDKRDSIELSAYKSGYFLHPEALRFCSMISQKIYNDILAGKKINTIVITGFADGVKNEGVPKNREVPTSKCHIVESATIDDKNLARLRSCVIWELLSDSLNKQGVGIVFGWDKDQITDIEDGGDSTGAFRKVVVEVIWQ